MLQGLIFHHEDDPICWHLDDQCYFGDSFLVAPMMNDDGVRDVYLRLSGWGSTYFGKLAGCHSSFPYFSTYVTLLVPYVRLRALAKPDKTDYY
jgi:alpha-D-xyloside xylohydrolase